MQGEPLAPRNPKLARLRRLLRRRSVRAREQVLVVEGPTMLAEALEAGCPVESVFVEVGAPAELHEAARRAGARGSAVHLVADGTVAGVADLTTPPPLLSVVARPVERPEAVTARRADGSGLVLVLAGVGDPGNAGTLLRSAEAVGATGLVTLAGSVDLTNPKVVRAAAGSLFRVPTWTDAPVDALADLASAGWQVVGTAADGATSFEAAAWGDAVALVLGSEAHGIPPEVAAHVGAWVSVPMAGAVESLNVAVAGTLVAFAATRARRLDAGRAPEGAGTPSGQGRTGRSEGESDLAGTDRPGRVGP